MVQGFVPGGMRMPRPTMAPRPTAPARPMPNNGAVRTVTNGAAAESRAHTKPKLTAEEHVIAGLQNTQQSAYKIWGLQFQALMLFPVAWVLGKLKQTRAKTVVDGLRGAPFAAMQKTQLNDITQMPANFVSDLADVANRNGGEAAKQWAPTLERTSAKLASRGQEASAFMKKTIAPANQAVTGRLDAFGAKTGIGGRVQNFLKGFTEMRGRVNARKAEASIVGVHESIAGMSAQSANLSKAIGESAGDLKKMAKLKESKASIDKMIGLLQPAGETLSGAAKTDLGGQKAMLETAAKQVNEMLGTAGLSGAEITQGQQLRDAVKGAQSAVKAAESHAGAASKGLGGMVKNLAKTAGRSSVTTAVITVGVAAGVAATWMLANKRSKDSKALLDDMKRDLGGDHAILREATKVHAKQKWRGFAAAGVSTAAESLTIGTMNGLSAPGFAGGAALMGAQMGLPMISQMLVPENAVLDAYGALKQIEAGKLQVSPEQHEYFVRMLVSSEPQVAAHGGMRNKLTAPIAQKLIAKKLTTSQLMKEIGTPSVVLGMATEAYKEIEAAQAPVVEAAVAPKAATPAEQAYAAAAKPAAIVANGVTNNGVVAGVEKGLSA